MLRNGPGLFEVGGKPIGQPFDGDGMVSRMAQKSTFSPVQSDLSEKCMVGCIDQVLARMISCCVVAISRWIGLDPPAIQRKDNVSDL